jgi:cytochrome c oxidase assembly factor CtaG
MMRRASTLILALGAGLVAPAAALAHDGVTHPDEAAALRHDWMSAWSVPWPEIVVLTVIAALYASRARQLGRRLPRWRAACFVGGVVVLLLAGASPIDAVGEGGVFWVHMVQHMMIGDLAALLLVLGVSGPILQPVLQFRWAQKLRVLAHPLVAFPVWAVVLVGWHIPVLYEAAIANETVHALEHISFLTAGIIVWAPMLETLPGPEWFGTGAKLGFLMGVRSVDAILANAFWWAGTAFYAQYETTAPRWGLTALEDQGHAGTVMMSWTGTVTLILAVIFFFRMAREGEMRQALIESGLDPTAVRRAVRYGRGEVLARRYGVTLGDPTEATTSRW